MCHGMRLNTKKKRHPPPLRLSLIQSAPKASASMCGTCEVAWYRHLSSKPAFSRIHQPLAVAADSGVPALFKRVALSSI